MAMTLARFSFKKLSIIVGNIWLVASVKELRNNCLSVTRVNSPVTCLTVTQPKATTAKREIREMSRDITVPIFTRLPPSSVWVAVAQLSLWEMGRDVSKTWGVS